MVPKVAGSNPVFHPEKALPSRRVFFASSFGYLWPVRKWALYFGCALSVLHSAAQPITQMPTAISAVQQTLGQKMDTGVDRLGPWSLSKPVAVKYGLQCQTGWALDERLDTICAKTAAEAYYRDLFRLYKDSLLADIAFAASPVEAVRYSREWKQTPDARQKVSQSILFAKKSAPKVHLASLMPIWLPPQKVVSSDILAQSPSAFPSASASSASTPLAPPAAPAPKQGPIKYIVKSGDSLWKIAKKFPHTTEAKLVKINKGKSIIYPGQVLWIPR